MFSILLPLVLHDVSEENKKFLILTDRIVMYFLFSFRKKTKYLISSNLLCPSIFNVGLARAPCCDVFANVPFEDVVTDRVEYLLEKFEFVLVLLSLTSK